MADFIVGQKRAACWVDCGLGKTLAVLTAIVRHNWLVGRVLVVAPKRVAEYTWPEEIHRWYPDQLTFRSFTGTAKEIERFEKTSGKEDITVVSVEAMVALVDKFKGKWRKSVPWNWLVLDESSLYKSGGQQGSNRNKAAKFIANRVEYVTQLTGTPATNGLMDLYGQFEVLDGGAALGRTLTDFRNTFFAYDEYKYTYKLRPGMDKVIRRRVAPSVLSLEAKDHLDIPETVYNDVRVYLPPKLRAQYERLEEEFLLEVEGGDVAAFNEGALSMKLQQFSNGAIFDEDRNVHLVHDLKLDALDDILTGLAGAPLLLGFKFTHDWTRIKKRFPFAAHIDERGVLDRWRRGEVRLLCSHPASGGHGLNIAEGGEHTAWFGEPFDLEHIIQFESRLGGARAVGKQPVVHRILVADSVEQRVAQARIVKGATMRDLMGAMKRRG